MSESKNRETTSNKKSQGNFTDAILSVPVRIKISGIIALPVLILGVGINYWIRTGLSDWLSYILDDQRVKIAMDVGGRSVLLVTGLAALFSLVLALYLTLFLTKPLIELSNVAKDVAEGRTNSRARIWSKDEIGDLALSVNSMIDLLLANQETLEKSNKRLEAINHVATAIGTKVELQEILDTALTATLDVMDLQAGWICLVDPNTDRFGDLNFEMVAENGMDGISNPPWGELGSCQCQQLGSDKSIENFISVDRCSKAKQEQQSFSHLSIPLMLGDQQYGMLNLICEPDFKITVDDQEMLETIGTQISENVTNAQLLNNLFEKEKARQTLLQALVQAQENERAKLSRRLHDDAGQVLTGLMLRLKALQNQAPSEKFSEEIGEMCDAFSNTIENVRGISRRLQPAALEEFGIEVALRSLSRDMLDAAGIEVRLNIETAGLKFPFEINTCIFRIAQESITNIIRHAQATQVEINLGYKNGKLELVICDNGQGFDPASYQEVDSYLHLGLRGMQERVEIFEGELAIISAPNQGTEIQVGIPVHGDVENE